MSPRRALPRAVTALADRHASVLSLSKHLTGLLQFVDVVVDDDSGADCVRELERAGREDDGVG